MASDRSWMQHRLNDENIISEEYKIGVKDFVNFACERVMDSKGRIRCPCIRCGNLDWKMPDEVVLHLYRYGIIKSYTTWNLHGETGASMHNMTSGDVHMYDAQDMLRDIEQANSQYENVEEEPNNDASNFYKMVEDASLPIYPNNAKYTRLSFVTKLLHFKNKHNCSQKGFDELLELIGSVLPDDHTLPKNYYEVKKMVKGLNMGYEKIDACENDCMLFYKENNNKYLCDICGASRYKEEVNASKKPIPKKILRYFPITPRLQRLYMSRHTAQLMRWYKNRDVTEDLLSHPADGDEWKQFDLRFPSFAREVRNVRLGLSSDGFDPFRDAHARDYTVWPVIIVVYNLPPSMCMKSPYMFMSLIIPGPKSPSKDFNVYLRPLIDELKFLWQTGVDTFDSSLNSNFVMRAALMWTISDFPALGMISGWSTHGKLSCPVCLGKVKGFQLKHGGKCSFFGCSRLFLEPNDPLRRNTQFKTRETQSITRQHSGSAAKMFCDSIVFPPPGKSHKEKPINFGVKHNWTHRSLFWELPYWETLRLRHCIDVMHTEKNVFDNIFFTMIDDKKKSKDNLKARYDCQLLNVHSELWIQPNGTKPNASYVLVKDQVRKLCQWILELQLPDGYMSNIARCAKVQQGTISGMKSHDCHVFMQKLLPIVCRDLLPRKEGKVLIELCNFFQDICSTTLKYTDLEKMEKDIVKIMSKLETIYPPSFFDSMEHLPIHLATECKLGGPVTYRWMYVFERYLHDLKMKVRNKARAEGSMAERYVEEESVHFCSLYFDSKFETVHNQLRRNEAPKSVCDPNLLEAYTYPTKALGRNGRRLLSGSEHKILTYYILTNMPEVENYLGEFEDMVYEKYPNMSNKEVEAYQKAEFRKWFLKKVESNRELYLQFNDVIKGPLHEVESFKGCVCNGYRFHCGNLNQTTTPNSGVLVIGSSYNELYGNYYGRLEEVLKLTYHNGEHIVAFKCHWFDSTTHVKMDTNRMTTVNVKSQLASEDVFVLASQAIQIYYAPKVINPDSWYTVVTTKRREFDETISNVDAFQEEMSNASSAHVEPVTIHNSANFYIDLGNFEDDRNYIEDNIDEEYTSVDEDNDNDEESEDDDEIA